MTKHTPKPRAKPVEPPEPVAPPVVEHREDGDAYVGYLAPAEPTPTPPTPAAQHDTYPTAHIVDKGAIWELWERSADGEKLISYGPPSEVEKAELAWREGRTKQA